MTKLVVSVLSLLVSANAFASAGYVGTWCQRFDDFTEVLIIDDKNKVVTYSVGNEAGEKTPTQLGYVSQGASAFQIVINNEDIGVVDYKVRKNIFTGNKKLILMKNKGSEKFVQCSQ
ncbi:MAG: hypothetical protein IT287_02265 [Bdellovibrionaceae bacterium]|nr:hypothetical protein [Pseudobdellovibrionaceae bacterium]